MYVGIVINILGHAKGHYTCCTIQDRGSINMILTESK